MHSKLPLCIVALVVQPICIARLRDLWGEFESRRGWDRVVSGFGASADIALVLLGILAWTAALGPEVADTVLSPLTWSRLFALLLGAQVLSHQITSSQLDLKLICVAVSGLFTVPSFSEHIASVFLVALMYCIPIAFSARPFDPELPEFLAPIMFLLLAVLAWVHGNRRKRFLASRAASTFRLALACNRQKNYTDPSLQRDFLTDPYFTEEEASLLEADLKKETSLMTERDMRGADTPPNRMFLSSKTLGRGAFGFVRVAIDTGTNEKVASKRSITSPSSPLWNGNDGGQRALLREIAALRVLSHPNIIKYKGSVLDRDSLSLFVELCGRGTLQDVLEAGGALPVDQARGCTRQLLSALHYIHLLGLAHMDVKPNNVLNSNGVLKLSDFGSSKWVHSQRTSYRGTVPYSAPEATRQEAGFGGRKSDIWSMGCVLLELLTLRQLNHQIMDGSLGKAGMQEKMLKWLQEMTEDPLIPHAAILPPDALSFIAACVVVDPVRRPSAFALQRHAFVQGGEEALRAERFGAAGATEREGAMEERAPWWGLGRWFQRLNGEFTSPEMEREFKISFITPRLCLILPFAKLDVIFRSLVHVYNTVHSGGRLKHLFQLSTHVANLGILCLPLSPLSMVHAIRWTVRIGCPLFNIAEFYTHETTSTYLTYLGGMSYSMMLFTQLTISSIELPMWFGCTVTVAHLWGMGKRILEALVHTEGGVHWTTVEDGLSKFSVMFLTYAISAIFSHQYLQNARKEFSKAYWVKLAQDVAQDQPLPLKAKLQRQDENESMSNPESSECPEFTASDCDHNSYSNWTS